MILMRRGAMILREKGRLETCVEGKCAMHLASHSVVTIAILPLQSCMASL